jgi:hypothetical protein
MKSYMEGSNQLSIPFLKSQSWEKSLMTLNQDALVFRHLLWWMIHGSAASASFSD